MPRYFRRLSDSEGSEAARPTPRRSSFSSAPERSKDSSELHNHAPSGRQMKQYALNELDDPPARIERRWTSSDVPRVRAAQNRRHKNDHAPDHEHYGRYGTRKTQGRFPLVAVEAEIGGYFGDFIHHCLRTMMNHGVLADREELHSYYVERRRSPPLERQGPIIIRRRQSLDAITIRSGTPLASDVDLDIVRRSSITSKQVEDRTTKPIRSTILHRAELYNVTRLWTNGRLLDPQPVLDQVIIQEKPIHTKLTQGPISTAGGSRNDPIFEMTTYYAVLPRPKANFRATEYRDDASSFQDGFQRVHPDVAEETLPEGESINVRAEAGCVLTIHSADIIEAIESLPGKTDQLIYEGEALIIPEPFCVLLQNRDQMLQFTHNSRALGNTLPLPAGTSRSAGLIATQGPQPEHVSTPAESNLPMHHITQLYEMLDAQYLDHLVQAKSLASKAEPMCTFEWSWLLFQRDSLVYVQEKGKLRAYSVNAVNLKGLFKYHPRTRKPSVNSRWLLSKQRLKFRHRLERIVLKLSYLEFDGEYLVEKEKRVLIEPFDGQSPIRELPVFPAEFLDDPDGSRAASILERGERYVNLTKMSYRQHTGQTISVPRRHVHGRIIVDTATYVQDQRRRYREYSSDSSAVSSDEDVLEVDGYTPRASRRSRRKKKPQSRRIDPTNTRDMRKMTKDMYMICSSEVEAYILRERVWATVSVDNISHCEFDERLIDDLVISNESKRLIQALSTTYILEAESEAGKDGGFHNRGWTADIVPNKGEGQILLLHGKPGVGKTLTAECVAELTKRPLLAITCGDMEHTGLERHLEHWLRLGTLWNAVVLLDEADVYLESRQRGDLAQNNLVSVFLRALENYRGLLFLTTNRIGTFDEAILSRVHVVLHYPDLTDRERERIWETSFRRLSEERSDIKLGATLLDYAYESSEIKALMWNGREIRNAFNTMITLAVWDARHNKKFTRDGRIEIRREHLQQVATMSGSFRKYMLSLHGVDASTHAKMMNLRDDQFGGRE